jgi:hypothetical protein
VADIVERLVPAQDLIPFLRMLVDKYYVECRAALAYEATMAEASTP